MSLLTLFLPPQACTEASVVRARNSTALSTSTATRLTVSRAGVSRSCGRLPRLRVGSHPEDRFPPAGAAGQMS